MQLKQSHNSTQFKRGMVYRINSGAMLAMGISCQIQNRI